jgi:hypothetical protein
MPIMTDMEHMTGNMNAYINYHHLSVMELGHLLTRSGLTYPEVSSKVYHDSCQLGNNVSLLWVIYYEAFYLQVVSIFSCIPVICLKFVLFLIPLQFVYLCIYNYSSKPWKGFGKYKFIRVYNIKKNLKKNKTECFRLIWWQMHRSCEYCNEISSYIKWRPSWVP